jgi:hypothetical protein
MTTSIIIDAAIRSLAPRLHAPVSLPSTLMRVHQTSHICQMGMTPRQQQLDPLSPSLLHHTHNLP